MKKHKLLLTFGAVIVCLLILFLIFLPTESGQHIRLMKGFLEKYYSAESYDHYDEMMAGNLNVPDSLYRSKYEKFINQDAYGRIVAARLVLESEKIAKEYGCTITLKRSTFSKMKGTNVSGDPSYAYIAEVRLDFGDNSTSTLKLTGTMVLAKQDGKWIISRFTPRVILAGAIKYK